ncbi:nucleotidyltransferase domain-containing protein, partial [Endozoicomonas ascidiicola]|uniref:nucleotidyltransferase domain-containing protein n=1 Tax=Endozoicomonas ascidiicola TaxID=1698521 RepID=UPI00156142FE
MLEIEAEDKSILMTLLTQHLPNYTVWAFGSRVMGKARRFSDLDLVLKSKEQEAIPLEKLSELQEALACSDI